jgi:hypothetical protein
VGLETAGGVASTVITVMALGALTLPALSVAIATMRYDPSVAVVQALVDTEKLPDVVDVAASESPLVHVPVGPAQ